MSYPDRREVLQTLGLLAGAAGGLSMAGCAQPSMQPAQPVKWSGGTERPRTRLPPNTTDCHHHIYDSRYSWAPEATLKPGEAVVADYRLLQARLGMTRNVIVQPSSYGTDNRLLVESIAQFSGRARGVAVVNTSVTDAQLKVLHDGGVRGIRFNLAPPGTTTLDMVRPLVARIAPMGWHIQVNAPAAYLLEARNIWSDLPCPVVFDHLGRLPQPDAMQNPTFAMVRDLLQRGKAYVKLSGFYLESKVGPSAYSDAVVVANSYAREAPERCLWGTDWPHPTEQSANRVPDDAILVDAFAEAVPDSATRNRILVDNPAKLYQFS